MHKVNLTFLLIVCLFLTSIPTYTNAQGAISPSDITDAVSITVTPEVPKPNQEVSITIESSGINLNSANITWSVNGTQLRRGIGEKSITMTAGPLNSRNTVNITIESAGSVIRESVTISPAEIDFLWQGDTYTHPYYDGRVLWTNQSQVSILAIPHISNITNTSGLTYKWSRNGTVLGSSNGVGRRSLVFSDSILGKPQTIKLEVLSSTGSLLASDSIELAPTQGSLMVYEDNPLYGVFFNREVSASYALQDQEVTFTAFPFFFSTTSRLDLAVEYFWRTNTGGSESRNSVTYRAPEGASGSSQVTVDAKNKSKVMQASRKSFLVQFGQ